MSTNNLDRAMGLAAEYNTLRERGDVATLAGIRRTIEDLNVGSYVDGKYTLPAPVLAAMGLSKAAV